MDIKTHNGWVQLEPSDYTIPNDVFIERTMEEAVKINTVKANRFKTAVFDYISGNLDKGQIFDSFNEPPPVSFTNRTTSYIMPYEGYKGPARKGIEV